VQSRDSGVEFVFLTVGSSYRNGRRERISSSEAMIYQWTSLGLGLMVKKDNVPRPYITRIVISPEYYTSRVLT
jgi:hypothetical protein